MRQRINSFGYIKYKDLNNYLTDNKVFGFTVKRGDPLKYKFLIMFRDNKKAPEELYIEVSANSKIVLGAYTNNRKFITLDELKQYTKR